MVIRRRGFSYFSCFLTVLILLIGAVGVCYANWNEQLNITGSITTGNFCVNFDLIGDPRYEVDKLEGRFDVTMLDVPAGSETVLPFFVENKGSVPVTYSILNVSAESELMITLMGNGEDALEPGHKREDAIIVYVPEAAGDEGGREYGFSFELNFSQCESWQIHTYF